MLRNCLEEDMCLYCPNGSQKGVKFIDNFNLFRGHRQLFKLDGLHSNKLGAKDNIYFSLRHPSVVYANPLRLNGTHTPGQNMSDHRTSYHLPSHHVVDISHKHNDNVKQPKQAFLMETIPVEPTELNTDRLLQFIIITKAPRLSTQGRLSGKQPRKQDNIPETPEAEPISPDTLSLSLASPLLSFSQKLEELVYAGTKLSYSFAASPHISTKKTAGPTTTKDCRPSSPSSSCESSQTAATTPGPKPSSIGCRWTKNNW